MYYGKCKGWFKNQTYSQHRHFHPRGSINPSEQDIALTKRFIAIFQSMGISVYDHIIIGNDDCCSLKENGYMHEAATLPTKRDYDPFDWLNVSERDDEVEISD